MSDEQGRDEPDDAHPPWVDTVIANMREVVREYLGTCIEVRATMDPHAFPLISAEDMQDYHTQTRKDAQRYAAILDSYEKRLKDVIARLERLEPWQRDAVLDAEAQRTLHLGMAVWKLLDEHEDTPDREVATAEWITDKFAPGESFTTSLIRLRKDREGRVELVWLKQPPKQQ